MYKYIDAHTIEVFTGSYIKDGENDIMYVHPTNAVLKGFGYMELKRPALPEAGENQYITESYRVQDGEIHVEYTVNDLPEEAEAWT